MGLIRIVKLLLTKVPLKDGIGGRPMESKTEFLRTPGPRPWRLNPTRKRNPVSAVIYDAHDRLVAALAYGNADLIVNAVNAESEASNG